MHLEIPVEDTISLSGMERRISSSCNKYLVMVPGHYADHNKPVAERARRFTLIDNRLEIYDEKGILFTGFPMKETIATLREGKFIPFRTAGSLLDREFFQVDRSMHAPIPHWMKRWEDHIIWEYWQKQFVDEYGNDNRKVNEFFDHKLPWTSVMQWVADRA
jgi:hypothetical protein